MINKSYLPISRLFIPLFGICLFILLYLVAAFYYPGGSNFDNAASGFSWQHNYWCELMDGYAKNGSSNNARPVAITAMSVLGISLSFFWYYFSLVYIFKGRLFIRYMGISSMVLIPFLLVGPHDLIISLAGLLGIAAFTMSVIILFKKREFAVVSLGVICVFLCLLNNFIYYTGFQFYYLPIIQKFTFIMFLSWFIWVDILMYRRLSTQQSVS